MDPVQLFELDDLDRLVKDYNENRYFYGGRNQVATYNFIEGLERLFRRRDSANDQRHTGEGTVPAATRGTADGSAPATERPERE